MVGAAMRLTVVAAACATMTLSCVWPAEYEADAGTPAPPYIVWESAYPPFFPTQAFNEIDHVPFTVTVGDADVNVPLKVRFCERKTPQGTSYLQSEQTVAPSPDHTTNRLPVQSDYIYPCGVFSSADVPLETIRYLYVVVTDGAFAVQSAGCEVPEGSRSATAAWPFTCDKPK
jgi:hypothetical protein